MQAGKFISSKIDFNGRTAVCAIVVSFVVIIVAMAVSSGFSAEIRKGVSSLSGDITLTHPSMDSFSDAHPICSEPSYLDDIRRTDGVKTIRPVIYRAGVVKVGTSIKGVMFKGTETGDTTALGASVPEKLARELGISEGDRLLTYFVGEKVKARNFTVTGIWRGIIDSDDAIVINVSIDDLRRLNSWEENQASAIEITLDDKYSARRAIQEKAYEIGDIAFKNAGADEDVLYAQSSVDKYPQLFDWLGLIRVNVQAILILMIVVAGFNMVSGLLIMLFRHSSTIGILKSMGMTDRNIAASFIRSASKSVLKGMAAGNAIGIALCLIQQYTHLVKLNPDNYFLSFVPVSLNIPAIILVDLVSYAAIVAFLAIPSLFISHIDPADTVKAQ